MSPPRPPPLMGLLSLQSFVSSRPARCLGSSHPWAFPFPVSASVFLRLPSPITFAMGSSSHEPSLPCRVLPIRARSVAAVRRRRLPWGSVPLRDINQRRHIWCAIPTSRTVPSSAFRTPSTVYSATDLVGLFHPTATSRVHSPGVFPPMKPYRLVDGPYPHVVGACSLSHGCPFDATSLHPAFRASSSSGSVAAPSVFSQRRCSIPS